MAKMKTQLAVVKTSGGGGCGPFSNVTPANYVELARAHCVARGELTEDGKAKGFIVSEKETPAQHWAWKHYFAYLDNLAKPKGRKERVFLSLGYATVPTAWPAEFDLNAPESPMRRPDPPVSAERRASLAAMLRGLVQTEPTRPSPKRVQEQAAEAERRRRIAEGRSAYDEPPAVTTAEMAAYLHKMRNEVDGD